MSLATVRAEARAEGLAAYLTEAREFSRSTFGEGNRTLGVTKHIEKEIAEVRAKPFDLTEWIDIIILACDGYWRHGGEPEKLLGDMMAKLAKNKARTWPKPTSENEAVEHDRTHDDPLNPELGPEHREYWVRKVRTEAFQERESAYVKISQQLLAKYVELFPAYAWTDEQTAIDLMAAEIATLRIEKAKARAEGKAEDIAIIQKNAAYLRSDARDATLPYKQGVEDLLMMSVTEIDHGPSVSTVMADAEEAGKEEVMSRWKFFLSLIGLDAYAQQPPRKPIPSTYQNGRCPVCGTLNTRNPDATTTAKGVLLTRCSKCSAAFFQDVG